LRADGRCGDDDIDFFTHELGCEFRKAIISTLGIAVILYFFFAFVKTGLSKTFFKRLQMRLVAATDK
jgi:hypothetical protein